MGHDRKTYLTERLSELEKTSEFLKRTGNIRKKISTLTTGSRVLTKREIEILEKQGNRSVDWSLIRVDPGFIPDNILSNRFTGGCFLGIFPDPETGICGSCISDSFVLDGATVDMGSRLEKTIVCEDVQVSASTIIGTGSSVFGNGSVVSPGLESGGRDFRLFAELDMVLAEELVISGMDEFRERYDAFIGDYLKKVSLPFSVIDFAAVVHRLGSGTNVYIGPGARVENCQHMTDTTIVSSAEEPAVVSGAVEIASSVLQWGCVVDSGAMVGNSVLLEYSHAGSHAKISGSIIGHDTSIERGEVWASLVGPCVGFHHHSLLISAFWPRGKGNIGYGAMVGSNHTSRAQDQEIRPGEGMFFGLGSCIKFPANYSASPYSVIPSGLVVPSQKVEFPFSLLNQPRTITAPSAEG